MPGGSAQRQQHAAEMMPGVAPRLKAASYDGAALPSMTIAVVATMKGIGRDDAD